MPRLVLAPCLLVVALAPGPAAAAAEATAPLDASGLPAPAWQVDPELAREWRLLTGRYIFQRACVSCHLWGPEHLSRAEWDNYLAGFPTNHEPPVGRRYADLTAQFLPGKMGPNADQRTDALATFLLAAAPAEPVSPPAVGEPADGWDGLPRVGEQVPDFRIVDLGGREHSPGTYRGTRHLVLVFSRAHW